MQICPTILELSHGWTHRQSDTEKQTGAFLQIIVAYAPKNVSLKPPHADQLHKTFQIVLHGMQLMTVLQ